VVVQGKGVAADGVVVSEPAVFSVDASAAGTAELDVAVVELESCEPLDNVSVVKDENDHAGRYECTYTPRRTGKHSVIVTYGSVSVPRAPFKVKSSTCYSASYMRRTRGQNRLTISEVAADWHELVIPQRTMRPSIARVNEQWAVSRIW